MIRSRFFKYSVFLLFSVATQIANAVIVEGRGLLTFNVTSPMVIEKFIPQEITKTYALKIDADKSYFNVEGSKYLFWERLNFERAKYSISGSISIFEKHVETETYILDESKITSIAFESIFDNIDLSSSYFWNDNLILVDHLVIKDPDYHEICACSITRNVFSPYINGEFNGQRLELNGGGLFNQDELDGFFRLHPSIGATHEISYHIEASVISSVPAASEVVSSVPIPAAFYLFLSGLISLVFSQRKHIIGVIY